MSPRSSFAGFHRWFKWCTVCGRRRGPHTEEEDKLLPDVCFPCQCLERRAKKLQKQVDNP